MLASRCALLARLLLALLVRPGHAWLVLPIQSLRGASFGLNWAIGVATAEINCTSSVASPQTLESGVHCESSLVPAFTLSVGGLLSPVVDTCALSRA